MPTPSERAQKNYKDQKDLREKVNRILRGLEELKGSDYWSYTREYEMGQIASAILIMESVRDSLQEV